MTKALEVSDAFDARISALAQETGESKNTLVRQVLESALDDIEDYYRAKEVLRRIEAGEEEVISLEELERRLGVAD